VRRIACGLALLLSSGAAAQTPLNNEGIPPQIIPRFQERGAPAFTVGASSSSGGAGLAGVSPSIPSASGGSSDAMAAMLATGFGDAAVAAAEQAGINAEALAGIGQAESRFQNIPTANGSSSATGPWQVTAPTWQSTVAAHGLGYSASDITDPAANAAVASYVIHDYASAVSDVTGRPATTLDAYGAYVFGPAAGGKLANANPSASLSTFISQQSLANNGMQNWTVGDFRSVMSQRLGVSANQSVLS
jgi:hypothetical protein